MEATSSSTTATSVAASTAATTTQTVVQNNLVRSIKGVTGRNMSGQNETQQTKEGRRVDTGGIPQTQPTKE